MKQIQRSKPLALRRVTLLYAFGSSLWILLSDQALRLLFSTNPDLLIQISTIKGWSFTGVTATLLYITIQRGERSRRDTYDLLESIIEGTSDAIFVKEREGKYILVNESGANLVGKTVAEIIGKDDNTLFSNALNVKANDEEIMRSGRGRELEETVTISEETFTYSTNKYPHFDQKGNVIGLIGIAHNITERKQLELEREKLVKNLEARNEELDGLNLITANAVSTLELDALLSVLLDRLITTVKADSAFIFLCENGGLILKAQMGETEEETDHLSLNQEIARLTLNSQKIINIGDIQQDTRFVNYATENPNQRHIVGIPLKRKQHLVGVLQLVWYCPSASTETDIKLLKIAAERCTMAILNAQLFEETQSLQKYLELQFQRSPIGHILQDNQGYFTDWNPAAEKIFGYSKAEVMGQQCDLIVPVSERSYVEDIINRLGRGEMDAHNFNKNITKSGEVINCEWYNTPLIDENGEVTGILSMVQDVTERTQLEEKLRKDAYYDPLTELPVRRGLEEQITTLLETEETLPTFALFHLDLVRFKTIKYSLGHHLADDLLVAISDRLKEVLPEDSIFARIGTDEFAILLEDVETEAQAKLWVDQIKFWLNSPFHVNEKMIFSDVNIGLVLNSQSYGSAKELLQAADTAMQQAKFSATEDYAIFAPKMQELARERLRLDSEMRRALVNDEFQLYYQPIIALDHHQIVGFEALIRWQNQGNWVSPNVFIPVAEETKFIIPLDHWVLRQACCQLQEWRSQWRDFAHLSMSVNVSVVDLIQPSFLEMVEQVLQETGLPPQQLKLEITETAVMKNAEKVGLILQELKGKDIRLCLDDFGTGYSSLSYILEFPFDFLKIDKSFISNLSENSKHFNLVRSIARLANDLEMEMIVEGVETEEQLRIVQQLGCQNAQGYYFARSLPPSEIETLFNH